MRTTLLCVLGLVIATVAFAGAPQPSITGSGTAPFGGGDYGINRTIIDGCKGAINQGYAAYADYGWTTAQSFVARTTAAPAGAVFALSANGFTYVTLLVSLYTDDGLGHPGTLLFTAPGVAVSGLPFYPSATAVKVPMAGAPVLTAGTSYVYTFSTVFGTGACFVDGTLNEPGCPNGHWSQDISDGLGFVDKAGDAFRACGAP